MFKKYLNIYHFIDEFKESDLINLNPKISLIFRNYHKKINIELIKQIKSFCKKTRRKFYLSNEIKTAYKLNLDGVYIPSFNKTFKHINFIKRRNFKIIGSAHNVHEIRIKEKQNCDLIFLSPIFKIKKNKKPLGIIRFRNLKNFTKKKVIALGGVNKKNLKLLKNSGAVGFASISHIKKRPGDKSLGRFINLNYF